MEILQSLQQFAKIGKAKLIQLVGMQSNFKTTKYEEKIDETICKSSCEVYKMKKFLNSSIALNLEETCCSCCEKAKKLVPSVTYHNEKNKYKIAFDIDRVSKLQAKLFVLYHFFPVDKNGIVTNLSIKQIAKILNCTTKTVKSNNERLRELNYIWITYIDNDKFNILIEGYNKYHRTAKEGGSGYLYMSQKMLSELLSIDNVNALRLEIRRLIKADDYNIGATEPRPVTFTYSDIKRFLPSYVNYRGIIEKILSKLSNAFETTKKEDAIEFVLKKEYEANELIKIKGSEYATMFSSLFDNEEVQEVTETDIGDLVQMSFQYHFEVVYEATQVVIENYIKQEKEVECIGALVRQIVRSMLKVTIPA